MRLQELQGQGATSETKLREAEAAVREANIRLLAAQQVQTAGAVHCQFDALVPRRAHRQRGQAFDVLRQCDGLAMIVRLRRC